MLRSLLPHFQRQKVNRLDFCLTFACTSYQLTLKTKVASSFEKLARRHIKSMAF
jgi:hypothetical protein